MAQHLLGLLSCRPRLQPQSLLGKYFCCCYLKRSCSPRCRNGSHNVYASLNNGNGAPHSGVSTDSSQKLFPFPPFKGYPTKKFDADIEARNEDDFDPGMLRAELREGSFPDTPTDDNDSMSDAAEDLSSSDGVALSSSQLQNEENSSEIDPFLIVDGRDLVYSTSYGTSQKKVEQNAVSKPENQDPKTYASVARKQAATVSGVPPAPGGRPLSMDDLRTTMG